MTRSEALRLLRTALGDPSAEFRANQWEAIDHLVNRREKLLVIERTGWGKSSVYFISTRIFRDQGRGPTIIISPLLALMRNQIEGAERLGIRAETVNSTNPDDWDLIKDMVVRDEVDALLISPERLSNDDFRENFLRPISDRIGLFVVDEAHCISDWGHDFRPDYRRIVNILALMPAGMPILGTTATANDRVIQDIKAQLGSFAVQRGPLTRRSLVLQNIELPDQAARLAWLKENIEKLPGSGIIYTLTKRDALIVSRWLNECGIESAAYFSDVEHDAFESSNDYREHLEDLLVNNDIKAIVATSALGMGYDKPDLGLVIHYQAPGSIISYYQQVGRAGRAIEKAYGVLLSGREDKDIHEFFRHSAFPSGVNVKLILDTLDNSDGLSIPQLRNKLNLKQSQIDQVVKYLSVENPSPVIKIGPKWKRTAVEYQLDHEKIRRLTEQRESEWLEVQKYIKHDGCLMQFLQSSLDDPHNEPCGKCARCTDVNSLPTNIDHDIGVRAAQFLRHSEFDIEPRKQIPGGALPTYGWGGNLGPSLIAEVGKSLSRWGDAGWGKMVADDKHNSHFRDELVDAMADMIINRWKPDPKPTWLTCVPSGRHPELVPDFARRLASKLGVPFLDVLEVVRLTNPQKTLQNSYFQCHNLDGVFGIRKGILNEPVLLIDDAVDSGWTLTIVTALLRSNGCGPVYPATLTSTSFSN